MASVKIEGVFEDDHGQKRVFKGMVPEKVVRAVFTINEGQLKPEVQIRAQATIDEWVNSAKIRERKKARGALMDQLSGRSGSRIPFDEESLFGQGRQGFTAKIEPSATGTGLINQIKTPRDLKIPKLNR